MLLEEGLLQKYRGKKVFVDSNLLLLLLVGSYDPSLIARFKRVEKYSVDDFELLRTFVLLFSTVVTTPHVLTEVSNLANALGSPIKEKWFAHFQNALQLFDERQFVSRELSCKDEFLAFGLTDTALFSLCGEALLVTEDHRLSGYLRSKNLPVINFSDLRTLQKLLYG
jgi:rRNA-processing protein FCF1